MACNVLCHGEGQGQKGGAIMPEREAGYVAQLEKGIAELEAENQPPGEE